MTRSLVLTLALLALTLVGHSPAAPAPKPSPKGAEALLYIKRVPGRTDKEQAEIRKTVWHHLMFGIDGWLAEPDTEIPGLKGPVSVQERFKWQRRNVQMRWVDDTGIFRISCREGTPREQAEFVNNAVKHAIARYEQQKKARKSHLALMERIAKVRGSNDHPRTKEAVEDALEAIPRLQRKVADLSEVVVLDLAEVPPK